MGGGASKGSPNLKKAIANQSEADKLFDAFDRDGDQHISLVELYDAIRQYGESISAYWTLDMIKETIAKFDIDGSGRM